MVGAGQIGRNHASAVVAAGDSVAGVVDVDLARARRLADAHGAAAFAAIDAAVAAGGADIAVIATPSSQHLAQSVELVEAGLDVLVEKPHRVPGESAAPLRSALAAGSASYTIGMTTRHWPGMRAVIELVQAGGLGDLLGYADHIAFRLGPTDLPPWYFDPALSGGGILLSNGVHALDRMRVLLGALPEPTLVRLATLHEGHGCEDSAELRFVTAAGVPAEISLAWPLAEPLDTGLVVWGTRGSARVDQDGSWRIRTDAVQADGPALADGEAFVRQWRAVRDGASAGFGLDELEPTLDLIERIYRENA